MHLVGFVLFCAVLYFSRRNPLAWIILWEALRDPARKYFDLAPIPLETAGACLWVVVFARLALAAQPLPAVSRIASRAGITALSGLTVFVVLGIVAGFLSGLAPLIIALGVCSYSFPVLGFAVGVRLSMSLAEIRRIFAFYIAVNLPLICTAFVEAFGVRWKILGGIAMDWYRLQNGVHIPLPSGVYRSPDVLGYHAAYVFCFCLLLFLTDRDALRRRFLFILTTAMVAVLILSARRKMQGFCGVFVTVLGAYLLIYGLRSHLMEFCGRWRARIAAGLILLLLASPLLLKIPQFYHAATLIPDFPMRFANAVYFSPRTTIMQSGLLGRGLGSATQGSYHLGDQPEGNWQEDGFSRLFMEAGPAGAAAFLIGLGAFIFLLHHELVQGSESFRSHIDSSVRLRGLSPTWTMSIGLFAVVIANLAAALISHQHISGDPIISGFAGCLAGCCLSLSLAARVDGDLDERREHGLEH